MSIPEAGEPEDALLAPDIAEINSLPYRYPTPSRLVAIGDLHGDYAATLNAFRLAGVIDEHNHWNGGTSNVVQVGDRIDRGIDDFKVSQFTEQLAIEAEAQGGKVHLLFGNHELMNVALDFRYVFFDSLLDYYGHSLDPHEGEDDDAYITRFAKKKSAFAEELGESYDGNFETIALNANAEDMLEASIFRKLLDYNSKKIAYHPAYSAPALLFKRATLFAPGRPHALKLMTSRLFVIVGDTLFVHAGIQPEDIQIGLTTMDHEIQKWLEGSGPIPRDRILWPEADDGPLWYRDYVRFYGCDECDKLKRVLSALSVSRMVVGHSVQSRGIKSRCGGSLWGVDVGLTQFYADRFRVAPQVLEIQNDGVRVLK